MAHAACMPSLGTPVELIAGMFSWLLAITHLLWLPPMLALPIALIVPRRWPAVLACMAISFVSFIPTEIVMVGLYTGEFDVWATIFAPLMLGGPNAWQFIAALCSTLLVFITVQVVVGVLIRRRRRA